MKIIEFLSDGEVLESSELNPYSDGIITFGGHIKGVTIAMTRDRGLYYVMDAIVNRVAPGLPSTKKQIPNKTELHNLISEYHIALKNGVNLNQHIKNKKLKTFINKI